MTRSRRLRRVLVMLGLIGLGLWLAVSPTSPLAWFAVLPPLNLGTPDQWFINWRLRAVGRDSTVCRTVVAPPHVSAVPVADAVLREGCGWQNSVRVTSIAGARVVLDKMTCEMTAALGLWMIHDVQPEALRVFGHRVSEVHHVGSYACRNIDGSGGERSEHASANALDITGFTLASGRRISVLKGWPGDGPDAAFLRHVHARACRYFPVALGPAYNGAHRDHFHFDRGSARKCK